MVFPFIYLFFTGFSKTFTVSLERPETPQLKEVAFLNLGKLLMLLPCLLLSVPSSGDKGVNFF